MSPYPQFKAKGMCFYSLDWKWRSWRPEPHSVSTRSNKHG